MVVTATNDPALPNVIVRALAFGGDGTIVAIGSVVLRSR